MADPPPPPCVQLFPLKGDPKLPLSLVFSRWNDINLGFLPF